MNEENGQAKEKCPEEKGDNTHPPVSAVNTVESNKEDPKGTENGRSAARLQQVSKLSGFKKWLFKITAAEVGMLLLTGAIVYATFQYTKYARRQWTVMRDQLPEIRTQAEAAKSSADTAKEAVHLSERAYITIGTPQLDYKRNAVTIAVNNTGRIPSGATDIIMHEFTVNLSSPAQPTIDLKKDAIEGHWNRSRFNSVPTGTPFAVTVVAPKMSRTRLENTHQQILLVGFTSYNDGFPDTPVQKWPFCIGITYMTPRKEVSLSVCDPAVYLPTAEAADGYPNNESR
jgi:hypothetical protein